MLVAFPFYAGDVDRMMELLEWIHDLGGCQRHDALLVADAGVDYQRCLEVKKLAATSFKTATLISNEESVIGWIEGPKSLFFKASEYAKEKGVPFLQMETDAVPLDKDWMTLINLHYESLAVGKAFGDLYECDQPNLPKVVLSGIAVYPSDVADLAELELSLNQNWDIAVTKSLVPNWAVNTPLIHHLWGEPDLPPTFVERKTNASPRNAFTLDDLPKQAVIWHRNKDGTLISLLRKKLGLTKNTPCLTH